MPGITPFLWFEDQAQEAANRYVEIFESLGRTDSGVGEVSRYDAAASNAAGRPEGSVLTVAFRLDGQEFVALNGGPEFRFTEAASLVVECEDQAEIDRLWTSLILGGGEPSKCGWLKDRFGLSWQIVPRQMNELLAGADPEGAKRAFEAMLQMDKLDLARLQSAYEGVPVGSR